MLIIILRCSSLCETFFYFILKSVFCVHLMDLAIGCQKVILVLFTAAESALVIFFLLFFLSQFFLVPHKSLCYLPRPSGGLRGQDSLCRNIAKGPIGVFILDIMSRFREYSVDLPISLAGVPMEKRGPGKSLLSEAGWINTYSYL